VHPALPARADAAIAQHPSVVAATESAKAADFMRDVTRRSFRPRVFFNGALAVRGSGANVDGTIDNSQGLWPDVPNWAAGLTVSFPFLDFGAHRARLAGDTAQATAAQARLRGVTQRAQIELRQAEVVLDAAARIAANVPVQLSAARQADAQARARYDAGLTSILEVADAQRLLAQAESEEALASLAVWRARLALAAAGDLAPFISEAANPTGMRVKP
jgi:outer membrane protein